MGRPKNLPLRGHASVRFGSLAAAARSKSGVRFAPESGHCLARLACLLWAKSRLHMSAVHNVECHDICLVCRECKPFRTELIRGARLNWVKVKNPKASAVKREAEEDWGST
jgi:hypothetical protein